MYHIPILDFFTVEGVLAVSAKKITKLTEEWQDQQTHRAVCRLGSLSCSLTHLPFCRHSAFYLVEEPTFRTGSKPATA